MNPDTVTFFLIVAGGVVLIWSFRKASGRKHDIKEIEYLAFTSIWGTLLVALFVELVKLSPTGDWESLLANPLAACVFFSILGLVVGTTTGVLEKKYSILAIVKRFYRYLNTKI